MLHKSLIFETLVRRAGLTLNSATILPEYALGQGGLLEERQATLIQLKLDMAAASQFTWQSVHNNMLMQCSVALDALLSSNPRINEGQKASWLHASFKDPTLFGVLSYDPMGSSGLDYRKPSHPETSTT